MAYNGAAEGWQADSDAANNCKWRAAQKKMILLDRAIGSGNTSP